MPRTKQPKELASVRKQFKMKPSVATMLNEGKSLYGFKSEAAFIEALIREKMETNFPRMERAPAVTVGFNADVITELAAQRSDNRSVRNNINQLAKHANEGGFADIARELHQMLDKLDAQVSNIDGQLDQVARKP